jgi:hypothetical protein
MTTPTEVIPPRKGMNQFQPDSSVESSHKNMIKIGGGAEQEYTSKSLEPRCILPICAFPVRASTSPISPARNIPETGINLPMLQVFLGHNTLSASGVDEVFE